MSHESYFIDELCTKLATTDAPRLDSGSKEAAINAFYLNDATTLISQLTDAISTTLTANYMYGGKRNEKQYRASDLDNIRAILNDVKRSLGCLDRKPSTQD